MLRKKEVNTELNSIDDIVKLRNSLLEEVEYYEKSNESNQINHESFKDFITQI